MNAVPDRYIRKQTLANGERYFTQELKDMEAQVLGAGEKRVALEYQLFCELRTRVAENVHRVQKTAYLLAKLDVYCSLAEVASRNSYCRPEVGYGDVISIKEYSLKQLQFQYLIFQYFCYYVLYHCEE